MTLLASNKVVYILLFLKIRISILKKGNYVNVTILTSIVERCATFDCSKIRISIVIEGLLRQCDHND